MKKRIGLLVALSIMVTGISYPVYNVQAQEENKIESNDILQGNNSDGTETSVQQEDIP